ncbi:ATP-binding protein [Aphanizomenon flos-aquae NRERC-008]|uniref:AAA family ATPase n=1 Tax=Aphanizomenon flos-aquae FACHB-1249 TaxID=2692889 RepID=A0ABR8IMZ5_APHFL|nr:MULTISPECIES: ATP-binding protein [Aphanizomenon]MBD2389077.1 AAA family ATPase [Aphanizomenon flos-aquae FACHB-1171]MBD2556734.1 AAA family ATPase [Aphanizomenon flos-aquae FACHB-1290]MBD2630090.1 AAA family ATPase [Aphanizomenon sp. FACHB-1399]MBD2643064.1 AAA family ATPase [Aphanizomenon sp. FACHB-1401]MBD2655761.1 AAA family ATPase [Aphanizomenon flos-aquae FACHB-1265]
MKIEIANLGVIEKAEIDLKPLTVFIGGNGTGKTWTAYTLASILGEYGCERYWQAYLDKKTQQRYPIIDNAVEEFLQEGTVRIDLIEFAEEFIETYINDVSDLAHSWMNKFLATDRVDFKKMKVSFDLAVAKPAILNNLKKDFIDQQLSFGTQSKDTLHILKELGDSKIYLYILSSSEENILKKLPKRAFEQILLKLIFRTIHRFFHLETYIFPTERTGILPLFSSAIKIKNYINIEDIYDDDLDENVKSLSSMKLSIPVQDLKLTLESIYIKTSSQREKEIQLYPEVLEYLKLAEILEHDILGGKVNIENSSFDQEILYQLSENIKLEMTVSSSMVKELAPLVLCLRYFAVPNELLIIDEPEVNLHPAAQVQMIEFLAMLVQAGLKVLITTHSPYIIDHLANLMKAAKYEDKESLKERFYLERTEAFIPQEKVSVYLFEDGTAKNILHEDGRIDWGTFGNVSDDISHIFP